ncbi:zinc finger protein ZPR1 [Chytriomyces sp. MP71]|nr:zinc finger protein ZPR1 [Chytriomyces sp. MP71]
MSTSSELVPASVTANADKKERLFNEIGQNVEDDQPVHVIESLCMNCHENGESRIMLTLIPHFKEVILMCFECPHCGFKNNEIQTGSAVHELGSIQTCSIGNKTDLNRQVVKSESASVKFTELDFEIPAATQRGVLTTVEGLLTKSIEGLGAMQPARKAIDETLFANVQKVIDTLQAYLDDPVANPFTIEINDPAGNSYIENLCAPSLDPQITLKHYKRTAEQHEELGLSMEPTPTEAQQQADDAPLEDELANEVHVFHGNCSRCNAPSDTRMHIIEIPHFKEVVIMATDCEFCGYKSNEVKAGGAISAQGKRITLKISDLEDLNRDILKSETCSLEIPEIELNLTTGTLGGRFTTVEGLLSQVADEIKNNKNNFGGGDSSTEKRRAAFNAFLAKLERALKVEMPYTLILDDPLGNSYLQNIYAPDPDPDMTIEVYERTFDQNEELGLNDLVLEDYGEKDV